MLQSKAHCAHLLKRGVRSCTTRTDTLAQRLSTWRELDESAQATLLTEVEECSKESPNNLVYLTLSLDKTYHTLGNKGFEQGKQVLTNLMENSLSAVDTLSFHRAARLASNYASMGIPHKELLTKVGNEGLRLTQLMGEKNLTDLREVDVQKRFEIKQTLSEDLSRCAYA